MAAAQSGDVMEGSGRRNEGQARRYGRTTVHKARALQLMQVPGPYPRRTVLGCRPLTAAAAAARANQAAGFGCSDAVRAGDANRSR